MTRTDSVGEQLVLGGGLSGLVAARRLQELRFSPVVIEHAPEVGGYSRTMIVDEFCFDYTGHFLHLSRFASPSAIPFAGQKDSDWRTVKRKALCRVEGALVPAPVQYNLGKLPSDLLEKARQSYEQRPRDEVPQSFRDYVVTGFGQYLADRFLIPQNEKTMAVPLDRLSAGAVRRFFPPPDETRVLDGISGRNEEPVGYNAGFWYPERGGIHRLVRGVASGLENVRLHETVVGIDLDRRLVNTSGGAVLKWENAYSSIPLKELCRLTRDPNLEMLGQKLSHSSTVAFNFGVASKPPEEIGAAQWVYVPDGDLCFYRVGWFSNVSTKVCPPGCSAMYVEVGVPPHMLSHLNVSRLENTVVAHLERLGWFRSEQILCSVVNIMRFAYVHHTHDRDATVTAIVRRLETCRLYPIGRYGLWDYTSMEDCICSAIETVERTT